jgi:ribosomal protein L16 Arg81 hydroxylase
MGAPSDVTLARLCEGGVESPLDAVAEIRDLSQQLERVSFFRRAAERKAQWQMAVERQMRRADPRRGIDERSGAPDPATFFSEHYFANRPAIFRNVTSSWALCAQWSFDWLRATYGSVECEVMCRAKAAAAPSKAFRARMTFAELIDRSQGHWSGDEFYLVAENHALQSTLRALLDSIAPLPGILEGSAEDAFLWIGPKGTVTQLHHDAINLLNVQVLGSKRFVLVPPSDSCFVYNSRGSYSEVDVRHPDPVMHPLFAHAARFEFVLHAGDAAFIPVGWWHFVEALEPAVSLSFANFPYTNRFARQEHVLESTHATI